MRKKVFLLLALVSLAFVSCAKNPKGTLKVLLQDLPFDADSIMVTISAVEAHATGGGWITVQTEMKTFDLLLLKGHQETIASVALNPGSFTEIRLIVAKGTIVVNGQTYDLVVPSSEIKIPARFDVVEEGTTRILLDFDADKSIEVHPTGGGTEYILRPVITLVSITQ